jgi:hypothetical protein
MPAEADFTANSFVRLDHARPRQRRIDSRHRGFQNGWITMYAAYSLPLISLPTSTRIDIAGGQVTAGTHTFVGLPVVGFSARTFTNGTLSCGAGSCQGNYGSGFAFRYRSGIAFP